MAGHYFRFGGESVLACNTGTEAVPVLVEIKNADDVKVGLKKGKFTWPQKGKKFNTGRGTKIDLELVFKFARPKVTDPVYDLLLASFYDGTPISLHFYDAPIVSAEKLIKAWYEVMEFPQVGASEEGQVIEVKCEPTDYEEAGILIDPFFGDAP